MPFASLLTVSLGFLLSPLHFWGFPCTLTNNAHHFTMHRFYFPMSPALAASATPHIDVPFQPRYVSLTHSLISCFFSPVIHWRLGLFHTCT
ncbi:hypothetical protein BDW67DRAFT_167189 [Aspergillus spinulosporus]